MVADSITDSQLFRGSPISRDVFKKRKANLIRKLKQRKVDDARHSQWTHQWKRGNVSEDDNGCCSRLKTLISDRFSQAWSVVDDDSDDDLSAAFSSPTSVDDDDCFCCSKQVTEVDHDDSSDDDYSDGFSMFKEEDPSESDNKPTSTAEQEPSPDQKKEDVLCPLCAEEMDATDLHLKPCSSCEFKLCLFCYKKINEDAGVCPGCRKKYEKDQTSGNSGEVSFQKQRGGEAILSVSSSFQVLDSDSD